MLKYDGYYLLAYTLVTVNRLYSCITMATNWAHIFLSHLSQLHFLTVSFYHTGTIKKYHSIFVLQDKVLVFLESSRYLVFLTGVFRSASVIQQSVAIHRGNQCQPAGRVTKQHLMTCETAFDSTYK